MWRASASGDGLLSLLISMSLLMTTEQVASKKLSTADSALKLGLSFIYTNFNVRFVFATNSRRQEGTYG